MSAICSECEGELTYDGDCTWCQLVELRTTADALAKAVEAHDRWRHAAHMPADRVLNVYEQAMCDALTEYRKARGQ